jgi:hypothetical protein
MAKVTINGRAYGLRFDLGALEEVEAAFGDLKAAFDALKGAGETDRITAVKKLFVILANCDRGFRGEAEDVTVGALKHAPLSALTQLGEAIGEAIKESMRMETVNGGEADDAVHDGFLEELDAKNGRAGG